MAKQTALSVQVQAGSATLAERILRALPSYPGTMRYFDLLTAVFPADRYPEAWRYPAHGGPPACAMSFAGATRALMRQGHIEIWGTMNADRQYRRKPNKEPIT